MKAQIKYSNENWRCNTEKNNSTKEIPATVKSAGNELILKPHEAISADIIDL